MTTAPPPSSSRLANHKVDDRTSSSAISPSSATATPGAAAPGEPTSRRHQLRMGPAPFASFEDLSDELESPEDKQAFLIRLPGIREHATTPGGTSIVSSDHEDVDESRPTHGRISLIGALPTATTTSQHQDTAPSASKLSACTPRIDISRASSSSHHEDSKDSTPDNHDAIGGALGVGFREEGALELRSSTEELDFHDATDPRPVIKSRPASPLVFVYDTNFDRQRKDSQTSEICLLSISGRTSRLSSIGSQCSDHSRISTTSHLSVMSGQSGRSTSPHKMLLETSFCGSRGNLSELAQATVEHKDGNVLEKVLLARKHDPREAILAEGIVIATSPENVIPEPKKKSSKSPIPKPARTSINKKQTPKAKEPEAILTHVTAISSTSVSTTIPTISIASSDSESAVKYTTETGEPLIPGQVIKSTSGAEYTFIPLKGPLPKDFNKPSSAPIHRRRSQEPGTGLTVKSAPVQKTAKSKSLTTTHIDRGRSDPEPEYIRIKLKPDYMYTDDETSKQGQEVVQHLREEASTSRMSTSVPTKSPRTLEFAKEDTSRISLIGRSSRSPDIQPASFSPSTSRRSSLIKSREIIQSPECLTPTKKFVLTAKIPVSGGGDKKRSRSKSREREWSPASNESIDTKLHKKSSVFSIFKTKKTPTKSSKPSSTKSSSENLQYDGIITNVEFSFDQLNRTPRKLYYEQPLEGDSIRIPLHSPSEYENRTLGVSSKVEDKAEEKIEQFLVSSTIEKQQSEESVTGPKTPDVRSLKHHTSTSSENVIFSTKLGSNEEIFTTKLPKKAIATLEKEPEIKSNGSINTPLTPLEKKLSETDIKRISKTSVESSSSLERRSSSKISTPTDSKRHSKSSIDEKRKSGDIETLETQQIEIVTETIIKTPKTEEILITEKSNIEIKTTPKQLEVQPSTTSDTSNRNSVVSTTTAAEETSEASENDSEIEFINNKRVKEIKKEEPEDHERKTLVFQTDSFEDELPYVPTTLPQERSVAVPIVPIKQRSHIEMLKTRPIERPRSTTPINPSCIDDYCGDSATLRRRKNAEKLKISLPREDTIEKIQKLKSPGRKGTNPKAWHEFAEKGISSHPQSTTPSSGGMTPHSASSHLGAPDSGDEVPPPLPPRGAAKEQIKQWINFEEIPEKHKPPKRIQTIPSRSHIEVPEKDATGETVVYSYVNPEDCQCECHEAVGTTGSSNVKTPSDASQLPLEEIEPLLQDDDSSDETTKPAVTTTSSTRKTKR